MLKILVIAAAVVIGVGGYLLSKKADGPVEQAAERVIEMQIGAPTGSIDLTPEDDQDKED